MNIIFGKVKNIGEPSQYQAPVNTPIFSPCDHKNAGNNY
jgi:hypothetical protein